MNEDYAVPAKANKLADWLELQALRKQVSLGGAAIRGLASEQGLTQADVDLAVTTMKRRQTLLKEQYPFTVRSGVAARRQAPDLVWTALLLMSDGSPARAATPAGDATVRLEEIAAAAAVAMYGPGTESVRFGWPSDEGRPMEFADALRWLADRMGIQVGGAYRPPHTKDGGVDVVAWRPFPDRRSGFPVTLVQCTLERNYVHKAADIDLRIWAGWLRLDVSPATALAIPEVVPSGEAWNSLATRTIILDRVRLASLTATAGATDSRLGKVRSWTTTQLDLFKEAR